jgi:hypothetical protein
METPKISEIIISNQNYIRFLVKTHKISFGEDLISIIEKYVKPIFKKNDWIAVSEKIISVCQNNVRHISTVKVGWLAKLITKGVKKYPNDIGFSLPEKMQVAIDVSGYPRMILAMVLGAIGKIFKIRGVFWIIAGKRVSEIDGFNPDAMYPYTEYAVLPPSNPNEICWDIEKKLGIPNVIIDGNNINVKIIEKSTSVALNKDKLREILLDNPMGQDDEMTPIVLVRQDNKNKL